MNAGMGLQRCRTFLGVTQDNLGTASGISRAQISRIEHGKNPTISTLQKLSGALGIPLFVLIYMASDEKDFVGVPPEDIDALRILCQLILITVWERQDDHTN